MAVWSVGPVALKGSNATRTGVCFPLPARCAMHGRIPTEKALKKLIGFWRSFYTFFLTQLPGQGANGLPKARQGTVDRFLGRVV